MDFSWREIRKVSGPSVKVSILLDLKFEKDCLGRTESHKTTAVSGSNVPAVIREYFEVSKACT